MIRTIPDIAAEVRANGFAFVPANEMTLLLSEKARFFWQKFADSWENMPLDQYMADKGLYRRRRHAAFEMSDTHGVIRKPHQPHYQSLEHNPLNGGVERWFEPVPQEVATGPTNLALLGVCQAVFTAAARKPLRSDVEMHQFRIAAEPVTGGKPTPEGMHSDGVTFSFACLAGRRNVKGGVTNILKAATRENLGSFELKDPRDAVFLDDRRVLHGVTPISRINSSIPGHRDAQVLTFTARP